MATADLGFLLENLKQLLVYNANLIIEVKDQVQYLYNDLILFEGFLKDCAEKRNKNETLKALVKQIRNIVNEAEDVIEAYIIQRSVQKARRYMERFFHILDYPAKLRGVAKEIEGIREKIKDIYDNKRFGFEALNLGNSKALEESQAPVVEEENVVGFDGEADTIVGHLTSTMEELEVILITGMPGLGKTTLAKKVFKDPRIEFEFLNRAWVYVSQDCNTKKVLTSILSQFNQFTESMLTMSTVELAKVLCDFLKKQKYLIVMDDVWTTEAWKDFANAFPKNNRGSRILVTSRTRNVTLHVNPNSIVHDLRFLTLKESWELLRMKVFGRGKCPTDLETIGVQIAEKCGGLPLAIVVIAGVLIDKGCLSVWWEKVAESVGTYAMDEKKCEDILALSYDHLPYHLKSCFLYLAVFPEDFQISARRLIHLWIAEGFIQKKREVRLEDVAEGYLEELVNRSLVMVEYRRSNGQIKTCRIHDMLLDFCEKESAKENFLHEMKREDQSWNPDLHTYRRLCIHSCVLNYVSSKPSGPRVRSFLSFALEKIMLPRENISSIPEAFRLLRVLDVRSISFPRFPSDLNQLLLLRYLALSGEFTTLPSFISNLWNLQTLIIETSSRTIKVDTDIWKMIQLRHLQINAAMTLPVPPARSRKSQRDHLNENLQTLSTTSPQSLTKAVLARSPNLKKLGIRGKLSTLFEGNGGSTFFDSGLPGLEYLETLKLLNDVFPLSPAQGKLSGLPPRNSFPPRLKKLTLSDTLLDWEHTSVLGMLDRLEVLKLKRRAFTGMRWVLNEEVFSRLKFLYIEMADLESWEASGRHFPVLRCLVVRHCEKLREIPLGLADISSLQTIELHHTRAANASAWRIEQSIQQRQEQQDSGISTFKLTIYPPEEISSSQGGACQI